MKIDEPIPKAKSEKIYTIKSMFDLNKLIRNKRNRCIICNKEFKIGDTIISAEGKPKKHYTCYLRTFVK